MDARARRRAWLVEDITERNPFCPTCLHEPGVGQPGAEAVAQQASQLITWSDGTVLGSLLRPGEPKTDLPLHLVATMQAEPIENSFATIGYGEQALAGVYGPGEEILDGVSVYQVAGGVVHLVDHGNLEYLPLDDPTKKPPKKKPPKKKPPKNKKKKKQSKFEIEGAREAIECDGKKTCTIDRAFVEKLMASPALLARQARLRPSRKDGVAQGFKIYGVMRGTLPKLLGLRSGDLLTSVNGSPLNSMDSAMRMYQQFRTASDLSLVIQRKGKEMELDYLIR
jgi:general secretion pathway protein C